MRMEQLVGERFKERPSDCVIDSHALMIRGGYMKPVANGIFSSNPPLVRITKKISDIIRQEMDALDGQEVLFPVVMPAELWAESGRYESVGKELLRFSDRSDSKMVLGMTHEEAAVQLVREYGSSYNKYPFMIYQIQTKFRDEARPRAGLIRVREFTMKDAYSFHTSMEDMEEYYEKVRAGYHRIFARAGIPEVIDVEGDSGMMGGSISHEFMLITPVGEDTLAICPECGYRSNLESAECIYEAPASEGNEAMPELVYTPDCKTIEDVCNFLKTDVKKSCKAVAYQGETSGEYVLVFIRGDLEVNETKVKNAVGENLVVADIQPGHGLVAGFMGPYQFEFTGKILVDASLKGMQDVAMGGNKEDYHFVHVNMERDLPNLVYGDFGKIQQGSICPCCHKPIINLERGIEVGNIFQLGKKYTVPMGMEYLDENSTRQIPFMACYGIGVGRLAASVCEAHHDEYGPIWPMSIAPWQVHICCLRSDVAEVKAYTEQLYSDLQKAGIEVIVDTREVRAGAMFSDADLLGVPLRVVVSPKNLEAGCLEVKSRDKVLDEKIPLDEIQEFLKKEIEKRLA